MKKVRKFTDKESTERARAIIRKLDMHCEVVKACDYGSSASKNYREWSNKVVADMTKRFPNFYDRGHREQGVLNIKKPHIVHNPKSPWRGECGWITRSVT